MTESDFWQKIRPKLPPGLFYRRIEDASGNLGTYDTFLAGHGRATWFDLKIAGPNARPTLRPGQPAFGAELWEAGIPAWYLVASNNGYVRLIDARTNGRDWWNHVVSSWDRVSKETVSDMIQVMLHGDCTVIAA